MSVGVMNNSVVSSVLSCLTACDARREPYPHWLLSDALPSDVCQGIVDLPFPPPVVEETGGKRETHNESRTYLNPEVQAVYPVCGALAEALQSADVVGALQSTCGVDLSDTLLRIEYCQDTGGFWLEPHTDIGVKKFTMLIYLSEEVGSENYGTDIYDADFKHVGRAPYGRNLGLIFLPGENTWHGFEKRTITGIRKSLIVNYVGREWRSTHELAFPDTPVHG